MKPKKIEENNGHYHQIQEFIYKGMKISKIKYKDMYHGDRWTALFEYNTSGKLSRVKYPDGEYTFTYDGDGKLIQEKLTQRTKKNSVFNQNRVETETETNTFEYDSNNLIVKRIEKYVGYGREREYIFTYTYDTNQRVLKIENLTDKRTFTYEYFDSKHPLADIQLPNCFLVDYISFKNLPSKITPNQGSIYTNTIISQNSEKFPTEIERKDYNGFKMNIKITY
jgi:YD repeat-containing protein